MNRVLNNLGLCARARRLASGESLVIDAIASKNAKLVIISSDCEKNTYKKIVNKCTYYNVEYIQLEYDKYEVGNAIGKDFRVCIAILDDGFKRMILKNVKE